MAKKAETKSEEKGLSLVLSAIRKEFGDESVFTLTEGELPQIEWISSGSIKLNRILGKGWARGRIIEIYGPESSSKTTMALHAIAEAQKIGLMCAFVDAEHALDVNYSLNLGVRINELLISQPDCGEEALEIVDMLVRSGEVGLIVVDSVAALTPRAELEGQIGDSHMGLQARMMSQAMRKITGNISKSNCCVIFINQTRSKIGISWGSPETTTGGNALKFYTSQRIKVTRIGKESTGDEKTGINVKVDVVKNKVAPPFKECELIVRFGIGIDKYSEVLDLAVENNIIEKGGAWFTYNGEKYQGEENVFKAMKNNPELFEEIKKQVLSKT